MRKMRVTLPRQVQSVLEEPFFQALPDGEVPIPWVWSLGRDPLVLVLGGNAAGKSFFRRRMAHYLAQQMGHNQIDRFVHLSMGGRTGAEGDQRGFERVGLYGSERDQSTGTLSMRSLTSQLAEVLNKDKKQPLTKWQDMRTALFWDEPDLGLSKGAALGMGETLRTWISQRPPHVRMVFVATHSPEIVRSLWPLRPHYLFLGDLQGPADIKAWLDSQENPPRVLPDQLIKRAVERRRLLSVASQIWNIDYANRYRNPREIEEVYLDWMGIQRELESEQEDEPCLTES